MSDYLELRIISPQDLYTTNKTEIDISVSFYETDYDRDGKKEEKEIKGFKYLTDFKYLKLLANNKTIATYVYSYPHNKLKFPVTHTFEKVDFKELANSGFPLTIQARAYTGKSLKSKNITSKSIKIIVDTFEPRITNLKPAAGSIRNNVNESISAIIVDDGGAHLDRNSIKFILDDEVVDRLQIKKTIYSNDSIQILFEPQGGLLEKEYAYKIKVKDLAGNSTTSPKTKFLIDVTPPKFQAIEPENGAQLNTAVPIISALVLKNGGSSLNLESIRIILDGQTFEIENNPSLITVSWASSGALSIKYQTLRLSEGSHSIIFKIKDLAGNEAKSDEVVFVVDVTPPKIRSILPELNSIHNISTPGISAIISDTGSSRLDHGSIKLILDGNMFDPELKKMIPGEGFTDAISIEFLPPSLADGLHFVIIKACDLAGNESMSEEFSFLIDTTPPVINSVFPEGVLEKQRLVEAVTVELSDQHTGIDPSFCLATLTTVGGSLIPLELQSLDLVSPNKIVSFQFGKRGRVGLLGIGQHKLSLDLSDIAGNRLQQTYDFEIKHAILFENESFQVCRSFTDLENIPTEEPFLLPPDFIYGEDFLINIPGLVLNKGEWESKVDNIEIFVQKGANNLQVKLLSTLVWSSDLESRNLIRDNFDRVLEEIESKENTLLNPGAAELVRSRIVRAIPLAISEILPWSCGLNRSLRAITLLQGFRLRVSTASFQFCGPGKDPLNGMVPSGELFFSVSRQRINDGSFITTINPMATNMAQSGYTPEDNSVDSMIGGPADLHTGDLMRKHLAIVLPASLSSSATASSVDVEHVALVAADKLSALAEGIKAAAGNFSDSSDFVVRRFRGRTSVVVEFPLIINGTRCFVPIGTTLRQVSEQHLHWFTPDMLESGQVIWQRQWSMPSGDVIALRNVCWTDIGLKPQSSLMDFSDAPLLPGDQLDFRLGS